MEIAVEGQGSFLGTQENLLDWYKYELEMASSSEGCAKVACFGSSPHVRIFTELGHKPTCMQYLWAFGVAVWYASGHSLERESVRPFLLLGIDGVHPVAG
jgi:hypothetical protein